MKIYDMENNSAFLCYYCSRCTVRAECDLMEQDVFVNVVYRKCYYRYYVVRAMGLRGKQFFSTDILIKYPLR